jgi:NAD(P)-dependent dehydrogenase (short-subunit alcohol dehydrogenase family)
VKAFITGGTSGIGFGVAHQLTLAGWDVIIVGRNKHNGAKFATDTCANFVKADLSLMSEVYKLAMNTKGPLDALIMCAGVVSTHPEQHRTTEGYELTFATNYLGKYVLSQMLLSKMATGGCIVMVGGDGKHKGVHTDWANPQSGMNAARTASIAVDLYAAELASCEPHIRVHTCFPGIVKTNLLRDAPLFMRLFVQLLGKNIQIGSSYITTLVTQQLKGIHWNKSNLMHFVPPLPADTQLFDYSKAVLEKYKEQT